MDRRLALRQLAFGVRVNRQKSSASRNAAAQGSTPFDERLPSLTNDTDPTGGGSKRKKKKKRKHQTAPASGISGISSSDVQDGDSQIQFFSGSQRSSAKDRKTAVLSATDQMADKDEPRPKIRKLIDQGKHVALGRYLEHVNHIRNQNKIHVAGDDVPDPICTFKQLRKRYHINDRLLFNVAAAGFTVPTPIQMQAVPVMLENREILGSAPTGSGKTLAFVIPVLQSLGKSKKAGFRAVVLSPTRELATQTYKEFVRMSEGLGLRIHILKHCSNAAAVKKFGSGSKRRFDILVTTPSRLIRLLKIRTEDSGSPAISMSSVEWLIVDESDKLFETGKRGFRDQLAAIYKACESPQVKRAFFSATFSFEVQEWCKLNLNNVIEVGIGNRNSAVSSVEQKLVFVGDEFGKVVALRNLLKTGSVVPPVLLFVESIEKAKKLYNRLIFEEGVRVGVIHSEKTESERDDVVKAFREGKIFLLVCTELLGRGIDFKAVNLVINYDLPQSSISYIHRIGRTGRAGRTGKAVTFFTEADAPMLRSIANVIKAAGCPVPEYMLTLKKSQRKRKHKAKPPVAEGAADVPQTSDSGKRSLNSRDKPTKKKKVVASVSEVTLQSPQKKKKRLSKHSPIVIQDRNVQPDTENDELPVLQPRKTKKSVSKQHKKTVIRQTLIEDTVYQDSD